MKGEFYIIIFIFIFKTLNVSMFSLHKLQHPPKDKYDDPQVAKRIFENFRPYSGCPVVPQEKFTKSVYVLSESNPFKSPHATNGTIIRLNPSN